MAWCCCPTSRTNLIFMRKEGVDTRVLQKTDWEGFTMWQDEERGKRKTAGSCTEFLSHRWSTNVRQVEHLLSVVPFFVIFEFKAHSRWSKWKIHSNTIISEMIVILACCLNSCWCLDTCVGSRLTFLDMQERCSTKGSRCLCETISGFGVPSWTL